MSSRHPTDLDVASPNAVFAATVARRFAARRALALTRAAVPAAVVLPAALLLFGCYALLTLTGVGPDGWQARLCAAEDLRPAPACREAAFGRAAPPHTGPGAADPSS